MLTADKEDFPVENLPYGVFTCKQGDRPKLATAFKQQVVDISGLAADGKFAALGPEVECILRHSRVWNEFAGLGRRAHTEYRRLLTQILTSEESSWKGKHESNMEDVELHLPIQIGDYTDFWCSETHALNGCQINRNTTVLPAAWYQLPGGYMGRGSSIGVNQNVHRPLGQYKNNDRLTFGPCTKLDFEAEIAWVIGEGNNLSERILVDDAENHVFGAMLMNDWSARDFATWEVQCGGVTSCKNFATTVSPWIVSIDALEPFKIDLAPQNPSPLPYLMGQKPQFTYDVDIKVTIGRGLGVKNVTVVKTNLRNIYWSRAQMMAHFTVSGANFRPGDLFATGTISGKDEASWGCLMEKSWGGTRTWIGPDGKERSWLEDGDIVVMKACCQKAGIKIGFGMNKGIVLPARDSGFR